MDLGKYNKRKVVLVDESDNELGVGSLVEAHQGKGLRHRAFSLVLYRKNEGKIEVLLQKRAQVKPVFPGLWANTCCYNMAPGEEYLSRAVSRVKEEMGVEVNESALSKLYQFSYYAPDPKNIGWCENELDQVIVGEIEKGENTSPVQISPDPEEVEEYRWMEWGEILRQAQDKLGERKWAPWWKMIVEEGRLERKMLNE